MKPTTQHVRDVLVSLAKKQLMAAIIKRLPFMAWPILNPLVAWGLGWIIGEILDKTIIGTNLAIINIQLNRESKALTTASTTAKEAYKSGDKEAIQKADEKLIDAARDLIKFGRSKL